MRFFPLLLCLFILTCNGSADTTTSTTNAAPDRAAAAADGNMLLSPTAIEPVTVFSYEDILWGFRFLPDGRILATDKGGQLILANQDGEHQVITKGVPAVKSNNQGGLLDILLDPDFATNRLVYLTYSQPEGDLSVSAEDDGSRDILASTAVGRGRLADDDSALEDFTVLYVSGPKTKKVHHYGSRMAWGTDDHLYFTIGDRLDRDVNPQDSTRDNGKVYRIKPDGSIPTDNPFVDNPGAKPAIYSYGHRNPQSLTIHPETGEIWETEHGPRGGDEINVIEAGKNYGWPVISYGINYNGSQLTQLVSKDGMEQPLHYWVPSIAPSGMAFVTGDRYPGWKGDLMVGSLKYRYLQHVQLDGKTVTGEQKIMDKLGRVRDVRMGPDDYLYASVEGEGIVRLEVK